MLLPAMADRIARPAIAEVVGAAPLAAVEAAVAALTVAVEVVVIRVAVVVDTRVVEAAATRQGDAANHELKQKK
jgi:hypothetical protein